MANNNWFKIPKRDGIFGVSIVLYVVLFFLPWSYDIKILNISLLAWAAALLFLLAPVTGLVLTLVEKSERNK